MSEMVGNRNRGPSLAVLLALAWLIGAPPALAAERPCTAPSFEADPRVREQWPELAAQVQAALSSRTEIDACAHILLSQGNAALRVEVTLPDGRRASRAVS